MLPKPLDGLWLQYALAVGLALLGGVVRMLVSRSTHSALGVVRNLLIAAFGGTMAYLFSTGQGLSNNVGLFICGMTGLAGVEGLRALGQFYAASLKKTDSTDDSDIFAVKQVAANDTDVTDIFAGTKAAAKRRD